MTIEALMRECDASEYELRQSAELLGIQWEACFDETNSNMLSLAVMLKGMEFQPERIRSCCADPSAFLECLRMELQDGQQDKELRELLLEFEDLAGECWDQETDHLEWLLTEGQMLWQMHKSGGGGYGFAQADLKGMLLIFVIAVAAVFLLRPMIAEWIHSLMGGIG